MSIRLPNNNYGNYVQQGIEVLEELQTLIQPKSWRLDCIPKQGNFAIFGCDPSVSKAEIAAIFALRTKHPLFKIEILDSFYEGKRQFTFMPPPNSSRANKRQHSCLSPMYMPVLHKITPQQHAPPPPTPTIANSDWDDPDALPTPKRRVSPADPSLVKKAFKILQSALERAASLRPDQPPISMTVTADEVEPPLLEAMQLILASTSARINLVCVGHFSRTDELTPFQEAHHSTGSSPAQPVSPPNELLQRFVRWDPSLVERALTILRPTLEAASKLRPDQPPIQMAVTPDEIDPPLFEAMERMVSETGARVKLTYLE
jgi:hypothetical protein